MMNGSQKRQAVQRRLRFIAINELRKAGFLRHAQADRGKLDKLKRAEISMKISRRLLAEDSQKR